MSVVTQRVGEPNPTVLAGVGRQLQLYPVSTPGFKLPQLMAS